MTDKFTILLLLGMSKAAVSWSDFECGEQCVPMDKCSRVENLSCDFPDSHFDAKALIEETGCKQCSNGQS